MDVEIKTIEMQSGNANVNALQFIPSEPIDGLVAVFSHGYTSHKGSIFSWGQRLSYAGIPTLTFDLPGHYLGSFNEISSIDEFKTVGIDLFKQAANILSSASKQVILGGHSLGALMSLLALEDEQFKKNATTSVLVGLGYPPKTGKHLFEIPLYQQTLKLRGQLVSPALNPEDIFQWIKAEKLSLKISEKKLLFICGKDDAVVGSDGAERMLEDLRAKGNETILNKPNRLPHHQPELAASHIMQVLKKEFNL